MPETSDGERDPDLPTFNALRFNFHPFRNGIEEYIQSVLKASYLPRAVQVLRRSRGHRKGGKDGRALKVRGPHLLWEQG